MFRSGITIVHIAERDHVDPGTVSQQLHGLGLTITQGHHMVEQLPLRYSPQFIELIDNGPDAILRFVTDRVWGISATELGRQQLHAFYEFFQLHHKGVGVKEIARRLSLHRSTVAEWREGTDQPYLIRAVTDTLPITLRPGWKLLPLHLSSGGNEPSDWIQVPLKINSFSDVVDVIHQLHPLESTYGRATQFGLSRTQIDAMRIDLFGYLLGIMVGDSGKQGGQQFRYASMNLDLQLTKKKQSNEKLGEFVMLCANSVGILMERKLDKKPTGATALSKEPSDAFRWISERSPLLAWIFSVCLGLSWEETTTTHQVRMDWIFDTPSLFRTRFVQGVADSDGCVKSYEVEIASVPNSHFMTKLLQSLGMTTAHVAFEGGEPLKTRLDARQASALPIFNEFVKSYRYQKMLSYSKDCYLPSRLSLRLASKNQSLK